ncbi:PREDICTED: OX-2 membrane glycoprotein-like [Elephantulus edwardii]|uniref:OX-2 membrane glycoprotein-like n=1 Tax=Elephantulus edwardii TaxID=28737 RepID=UPI0003F07CF3|nr:PREDICTED: OX-2 membrane glycoprotein-like [Elephantulus edwardii]
MSFSSHTVLDSLVKEPSISDDGDFVTLNHQKHVHRGGASALDTLALPCSPHSSYPSVRGRLSYRLGAFSLMWSMAAVVLCRAQVQVVTQDEREPLHTPASLRCFLNTYQEVLIVTWQKMRPSSPVNMVTYSKNHGVVIQPAFKDRLNITYLGLNDSTITFWNTTLEDEGCYLCLFNTFGAGKISGKACLTLYVQPTVYFDYKLFEDHLNITCSATARPAPEISWNVTGSGIENSTVRFSHPNGTTSVTSVLHVKDPESQMGKEVICKVLHLGTVTDFRKTVGNGFWFSVPLLLSIVSLIILLVLISILLYWKRHRNQDRGKSSQHYKEGNREQDKLIFK